MRGKAAWAWIVAAVLVTASCSTGGDSVDDTKPGSTSVPEAEALTERSSGDRLDGSALPSPISALASADGIVAYYTAGDGGRLELVAVDPEAGEVVWTHPAAMSYQPTGVAVVLDVVDGAFAVLAGNAGGKPRLLELVEPDGEVRWQQSVSSPESQPALCGDRVCLETNTGPVAFEASGGRAVRGDLLGESIQIVGADGDATLGVEFSGTTDVPLTGLVGVPRPGAEGGWRRPLSELFGSDQVTITSYYSHRAKNLWVLALGPVHPFAEGEMPEFPYRSPNGSVAAFRVDDGEPLWSRSGASICWSGAAAESVTVLCEPTTIFPSAEGRATATIDRFELVGNDDGSTRAAVTLEEPFDLASPDERLLLVGPDRWALRDGSRTLLVDLRSGAVEEGGLDPVGWCSSRTEVDGVLSPLGEVESYGDPEYRFPCRLGDDKSSDDVVAAIVDGEVEPPTDRSVNEADEWVVWVEDGRLSGVKVRR